MKQWGAVVVLLYVLVLAVLAGPLMGVLFFSPKDGWKGVLDGVMAMYSSYRAPEVWYCFAAALVAQAALLTVPVELSARRPVTKRSIVPLALATALAAAVLCFGAMLAVEEVFKKTILDYNLTALGIFLLMWALWAVVFFSLSRGREPQGLVERNCRWLFRGSILELLVAVPSHVLVRQRNECCAGLMTGAGIACGLAVMLFAFGPGVYYLFEQRIRHLRKAQG